MLPISKLRGVPPEARVALKAGHITTSRQLLAAAALVEDREILAVSCRLDLSSLTRLVQRADLARIDGIGATFGLMLENLGICDVASLAEQARSQQSCHQPPFGVR
jgi:predicted flap endonuclease-1-like 5' DNA nuclease